MHPTRFTSVEGTVLLDYYIFIVVNLSWNLESMPCINQPHKRLINFIQERILNKS